MAITNFAIQDANNLYRARARVRHLNFMQYTWQNISEKFLIGEHTKKTCELIDNAFKKFKNGESSFLKVLICFRHGKSDMSSRYLPAHFLGEFPDCEVIVVSHNATKAFEFSYFGRALIQSNAYRRLYPNIFLSPDRKSIEEWSLWNHAGKAQYFGIGSGSAGKGGHLIIIDDYHGSREDAESEVIREKTWNAFKDDIMTRRAPRCIVILVVTPWHVDDVNGRIDKKMIDDKNFPKFETAVFPAFSKTYKQGILFPERFDKNWYESQKSTLGTYSTASLMQCDPRLRTGNMLRMDKLKYYESSELPKDIQFVRAYDIASSKKQRIKDDPDYTVGLKIGIVFIPTAIPGVNTPIFYIDDIIRGQWEALQRKKIIVDTAMSDGHIRIGIEAFAGYKDAYTELNEILKGIRTVEKMQLPGDKVSKASCLEPICEAGNLYINKNIPKDKISALIDEWECFPGGKHDDTVDAASIGYYMLQHSGIQFMTSRDIEE